MHVLTSFNGMPDVHRLKFCDEYKLRLINIGEKINHKNKVHRDNENDRSSMKLTTFYSLRKLFTK